MNLSVGRDYQATWNRHFWLSYAQDITCSETKVYSIPKISERLVPNVQPCVTIHIWIKVARTNKYEIFTSLYVTVS